MTGDMIVNLYAKDCWRSSNKNNVRVVFPSDKERVLNFVSREFPDEIGWLMEVEHAIQEGKCLISTKENTITGFACYDCTGKGYFGPFGVSSSCRNMGIGLELFNYTMDEMKSSGYGYAIIGWVNDEPRGFYEKAGNATYIPDSQPNKTLYRRKIEMSNKYDAFE